MIIRDFQDYAEIFCGCSCSLPPCDLNEVRLFCDLVRADGEIRGFVKEGDFDNAYKSVKTTWSPNPNANPPQTGHTTTYSYNSVITVRIESVPVTEPIVQTIEEGGGDSFKQPTTSEYSEGVLYTDGVDQILAIMDANTDFDSLTGAIHLVGDVFGGVVLCQAFRTGTEEEEVTTSKIVTQQAARIRMGWRPEPPPIDPEEPPDPEALGEVAIKPYFKMTWDVYLMSENYRKYLNDIKSWAFFKEQHDNWVECEQQDPGFCGPEPIVPDKPEEPTPAPELVDHFEWESINGQPAFSNDLVLPIIDLAPFGEERQNQNNVYVINNLQAVCFRSARLGNIPTSFATADDFPIDPPIE